MRTISLRSAQKLSELEAAPVATNSPTPPLPPANTEDSSSNSNEEEIERLTTTLASVQKRLSSSKDELNTMSEQYNKIRESKSDLVRSLEEAKAELARTESEKKAIKAELARTESEKKALKHAAKALKTVCEKLEGKNKILQEEKQAAVVEEAAAAAAAAAAAVEVEEEEDTKLPAPAQAPAPAQQLTTPERKQLARKKFADERKQMLERAQQRQQQRDNPPEEQQQQQQQQPSTAAAAAAAAAAVEPEEDSDSLNISRASSVSSSMSNLAEWEELFEDHPLPPFELDSPVISHLLTNWTTDKQKLQYLKLWLQCLADDTKGIPETFPSGLTLLALAPEIKDGFLTLVVPILRKRKSEIAVKVFARMSEQQAQGSENDIIWDLKLKIIFKRKEAVLESLNSNSNNNGNKSTVENDGNRGIELKNRIQARLDAMKKS